MRWPGKTRKSKDDIYDWHFWFAWRPAQIKSTEVGSSGSHDIFYDGRTIPKSTIDDAVNEITQLRIQLNAALQSKTLPFPVGGIA